MSTTFWSYDDSKSTTSSNASTINAAIPTPPETVSNPPNPTGSIPWTGSTYIIKSAHNGDVITLFNGKVCLKPPGSNKGSIHWKCEEQHGWLGFKNPVSNRYLGHDKNGRLTCVVGKHSTWEDFCVRLSRDGRGFVLLMTHWEKLLPVCWEDGGLARVEKVVGCGSVWEFVEVGGV